MVEHPGMPVAAGITADGSDYRDDADIAEITTMVNLDRWPAGTRMIVRREIPHPGAQLSFTDIDGRRFQAFITDQTDPDIAYLAALQRGRGRAEKLICNLKDTGCANLPSADIQVNQAWLTDDRPRSPRLVPAPLPRWRPRPSRTERLRYTLVHAAGLIAHTGRQTRLRIAAGWPWADQLVNAFDRCPRLGHVT